MATPKERLRKAELARAFLENEQIQRLWTIIEADIVKMWAGSASTDMDGREACYRELHGLRALKARLDGIVTDGRKAEEELKHEQSDRTRPSR